MIPRRVGLLVLSLVCSLEAVEPVRARAGLLSVDFSASHNLRLQDLLGGSASQLPEGNLTLGGVPFSIPTGGNNFWSAAPGMAANPRVLEVPIGIDGVDKVYTLMNTFWGEKAAGTKASVEFVGSAGAMFSLALDGNVHVRDYLNNIFTNSINGTSTVNVFTAGSGLFNEVRLDMQIIDLPPEFLSQTLVKMRVIDNGVNDDGMGMNDPQRVFLAGVTVESVVPEPGGLTLVGLGMLAIGSYIWRRRSGPSLS
jgi:hypothetical protein